MVNEVGLSCAPGLWSFSLWMQDVFSITNVRKLFIAQSVLGAKRLGNERWQSKHEREHETIKERQLMYTSTEIKTKLY